MKHVEFNLNANYATSMTDGDLLFVIFDKKWKRNLEKIINFL